MSFIETPRFPDAISYGATGGPEWSTTVVAVASGFEARNQNWTAARHRYDVSHVVHDGDGGKKAALIAFFHIARGRANAFRYKDWADFSAGAGEGVLTSLSATTWQMAKRYTAGAGTFDRVIRKPVSGSVTLSGGGSYSIDYATGVVTKSAGADPTGWVGEFDVPVRFDTDQLQIAIEAPHGYGHWAGISLVEVRL